VLLDRDAIWPNAAKRGIAKLCVNYMWGKLTERNNRLKTRMISKPQELYRLLTTPEIGVTTLLFCSDEFVWTSWRYTDEENVHTLRHTNDVFGSYVTGGARLRLYSYLNKLQERSLYWYRQCTVRTERRWTASNRMCRQSRSHGIWTRTEWVHPGICKWRPKNYSYKVVNTRACKTVCKVRGITLNYNAKHLVNVDVIKWSWKCGGANTVTAHRENQTHENSMWWRGGLYKYCHGARRLSTGFFYQMAQTRQFIHPFRLYKRVAPLGRGSVIKDCSCSEQDLKFKHPFTCIISRPTGSGKSSFCIRLLQNLDALSTGPDFRGGIVWC
jgi:hypothetical protein